MSKARDWGDVAFEGGPGAIRMAGDDPDTDIPFGAPTAQPNGRAPAAAPFFNGRANDEAKPKKPAMTIEWFDEAADSALSEPANHLIEGVLDEGGLSVIYGDSGSGKTFAALDMAFHAGAGLDWNWRKVKRGLVRLFRQKRADPVGERAFALAHATQQ